jgi:MraZ protein
VSNFLGRFEYQLDDKGRVSLPAAFRRGAEDGRFVLLQWEEPYLTLYPEAAWLQVQERLLQFRRSQKDGGAHVRRITSSAVEIMPDKQGRILIPSWLQQAAGLDGTVLMIGAIDRIEIWNPGIFAGAVPDSSDGFEHFAPQIFG